MTCSICLSGRHIGCRGCGCGICRSPNGYTLGGVTERRQPKSPRPPADRKPRKLREPRQWTVTPAQLRMFQIMKQTGGTWSEIARALGVDRTTLRSTWYSPNAQRVFAEWCAETLPLDEVA